MITCNIMGGLGNQLFQIFAAMAVGIRDGHKIILPYWEVYRTGSVTRYSFWDSFLAPIKIFTNFYNKSVTNDILLAVQPHEHFYHSYMRVPDVGLSQNIRLFGYFQSYKYFIDQQPQIYKLICLESQCQSIKNEYLQLFYNGFERDNRLYTISMHFRQGDYKYIQDCHNILPYDYYENALKYIISQCSGLDIDIRVLYFCEAEDNECVQSIINKLSISTSMCNNNIGFIKVDDTIDDWKQMLLMSCCRSNIIANSTFSWWGAYFNTNINKIVCYPSKWFGPVLSHNYMGDMFPPEWSEISV